MPRVLLAPDSFKGSLSAVQFCQIARQQILAYAPETEVMALPLSDGGEGFAEAFIVAGLAQAHSVWVSDPLGRRTKATFAWQASTQTAFVEMAQASGLHKVRLDERNPLQTHSYGTGQLLQAALDLGAKKIVLGLGGSATNDGGMGALQALGVEILDSAGDPVLLGGQGFRFLDRIGQIPQILQEVEWVLAVDVRNPLLGEMGATAIFGPQKGLQTQQFTILEEGMRLWAQTIAERTGRKVAHLEGAGAAGGMAAGLVGIVNAQIVSGFEVLRAYLPLDAYLQPKNGEPVDWVLTGEGRIDAQTAYGKLPLRMAELAATYQVPCIGVAGSLAVQRETLPVFTALFSLVNQPMHEREAMAEAPQLLAHWLQNALPLLLPQRARNAV
ncbi:MAG: glycerate kinase [Thiotrichales bacterium]|nr:glycerate kinase [Thiotrichales bacterium]